MIRNENFVVFIYSFFQNNNTVLIMNEIGGQNTEMEDTVGYPFFFFSK